MEEYTTTKKWLEEFKNSEEYKTLKEKPVAYFSAEYALSASLPTYAGGLGILAGDMVHESSSQDFPIVFLGLFYKQGQNNITIDKVVDNQDVTIVQKNGEILKVSIPLDDRRISFQIWQYGKDNSTVYLLDTDIEENNLDDRMLTHSLYAENRDVRLRQEILLGIGGRRALEALGIHPSVYHLNEGHSAFLALELISHEMRHQKVNFEQACTYASSHILFTNHTLVAAGQELFANSSVRIAIANYAKEVSIDIEDIVNLGKCENPDLFSMTMFSFKFSIKSNSVSLLHGKVASSLWPDYKMENVTNGIHIPRWDSIKDPSDIYTSHQQNKQALLDYIEEKTGKKWDAGTLLFGWGRRFVPYKQPLAFIKDLERLISLANNTETPFKIVFSGPTSENYNNELIAELKSLISGDLDNIVVFLPHYNIPLAKILVSGCDVWLNTPQIGREACGTSGMKAGLNGVPTLSTNDGWVAEVDMSKYGWVIKDDSDLSKKLLDIVENEIVPAYYSKDKWVKYMQNSRDLTIQRFSMTRALKEYIEKFYLPILKNKHAHKFD